MPLERTLENSNSIAKWRNRIWNRNYIFMPIFFFFFLLQLNHLVSLEEMTGKHNSGKTRVNTAFWVLHDTTDPLHDTVIMPIGGYTHGRGFKVHAYRFNNCKEKQKQKNFKKKEKQPNARCICTVSLLHCTLEGGLAAPSPHPANQGQNPTTDMVNF